MSETTTTPSPEPQGAPGEPATEAPETGITTEGDTPQEPETSPQPAKPSRTDQRIAALRARVTGAEQERDRLAAELRQARGNQPEPELTVEQKIERRVSEELAKRSTQERVEAFHAAGKAAHHDWQQRCDSLMEMGADPAFAELLVEMPDGAKVAASLADDPEEMERIAGLKSERARAIALGKYAATIESRPAPAPARRVSEAPAPIRPVTGRAAVAPNEYAMNANDLAALYMQRNMEKRIRK